jgi:hypothetical protein
MTEMRLRTGFVIAALLLTFGVSASRAAVSLSTLTNPTVQTLIDLGSDGVAVGPIRFFDFTFAGSSSNGSRNAGQVAVQPITADGFGIRFLSPWFVTGGSALVDVITYKLEIADPSQTVGRINLFSDGTAPLPAAGTFVSTSLSARTTGGAMAGRIVSTFDDGRTSPFDTTQPDTAVDATSFDPQLWLSVTDAISTASGGGISTGVATASIVENTFVPVPEPRMTALVFVPGTIMAMMFTRRLNRRRARRARRQMLFGLGAAVG